MSYLLLGAIFLGIGAHASSAREVQTLSMPVTMAQVVIFALARRSRSATRMQPQPSPPPSSRCRRPT